jgi:hypothetical protein
VHYACQECPTETVGRKSRHKQGWKAHVLTAGEPRPLSGQCRGRWR